MSKSPFKVYQHLFSPKQCEMMIDTLNLTSPDRDEHDKIVPTKRFNQTAQNMVFDKFQQLIPEICEYYDVEYKGSQPMTFEWYSEGAADSKPTCDNSTLLRGKWVKTRDRDLSVVLFLSDYNETPSFDDAFEVYGGKYEFPQHDFGFNAQRGTAIVYPSGPHFVNATSPVKVGNLVMCKFFISTTDPYLYDYSKFPGDVLTWFKDVA